MNANTNSEQELTEQLAEGELSDEALEAVAGGICLRTCGTPPCIKLTRIYPKAES